jgi:putative DNA primase/helicase
MLAAAKAIKNAGAHSIRFVDLEAIGKYAISRQGQIVQRTGELPSGWDAADALAEGWTTEAIATLIVDHLAEQLPCARSALDEGADTLGSLDEPRAASSEAAAGPYLVDETRGLFYVEQDKDGKVRQTRICGVLKIESLKRNSDGADWGPVLDFRDRDGRMCQEVIPYRLFLGQGIDGLKLLADLGLEIEPTTRALDLLRRYVVGAKPTRRATSVSTTGWYKDKACFVLPDGTIGEAGETVLFDGSRRAEGVYSTAGKLDQWRTHIGNRALGNPMLMLVLSMAFSGPLLKPLGLAGFALNLVGDSSTGKTAGLVAAGSVWGPTEAQVKSWRSTSNALEYTCALHNHTLLCQDEFREVDPKDATPITYMIANGRGKVRAHHAGGLRDSPAWAIVMLSSGELGLGDHIAAAGQKQYAGQEVRFIELDANAGARLGMWNDVGGSAEGGKGFSDALKRDAMRYHGTAGRAFIGHCCQHYDDLPGLWRAHEARFAQRFKPSEAQGQVVRVMTAFSLIGFAGELSARWGVTTWNEGEAFQAAGAMFEKWRRARPTQGNSEEGQILAHVRQLMERSWHSKFHEWDRVNKELDLSRTPSIIEPLGFRKILNASENDYYFYVTRGRFETEFAQKAGFKTRRVAAVLKAHGILRCDDESTTYKETLPNGDPRSYCLIGSALWGVGA